MERKSRGLSQLLNPQEVVEQFHHVPPGGSLAPAAIDERKIEPFSRAGRFLFRKTVDATF